MPPKRLKGYKPPAPLRKTPTDPPLYPEGHAEPVELKEQERFLDAYMETASLSKASRITGTSVRKHYNWAERNTYGYPKRFAKAHEIACAAIEGEIARRAMDGVKRPQTFKGELIQVGYDIDGNVVNPNDPDCVKIAPLQITEYSDQLLTLYAKGAMPDKYRERSSVDVTRHNSIIDMTEEELQEQEERLGLTPPSWTLPDETPATPMTGDSLPESPKKRRKIRRRK